ACPDPSRSVPLALSQSASHRSGDGCLDGAAFSFRRDDVVTWLSGGTGGPYRREPVYHRELATVSVFVHSVSPLQCAPAARLGAPAGLVRGDAAAAWHSPLDRAGAGQFQLVQWLDRVGLAS